MRVIYVDDEEDIREVAVMALETVGEMSVVTFASGQALLDNVPEPPDVLLLDVMMPGINGVDLLETLRGRGVYNDVPAIFMTAKAQPSEIETLMNAGAVGVIRKPFDPMTLADQVNNLLLDQ